MLVEALPRCKKYFVVTMFVPYSIACLEWNVPCLPVNPYRKILGIYQKEKALTAKIKSTSHVIVNLADNFALLGEQHVWSSLSIAASDSIFAASGWNKKL